MTDERVIAVIPALDEGATIEDIVTDLTSYVDEVIVVDDGSTDQTATIAREAGAIVLKHDRNRGYDRSIEDGFERAIADGATVVVTFDADGQHVATDIPAVMAPIRSGSADIVVGRRPERSRLIEHLFGWYGSVRIGVSDILCGFKAYAAPVYQDIGHFDEHATIGTQLLFEAKKQGYVIEEVDISLEERLDESRFGQQLYANVQLTAALCRLAWFDLKG